MKIGLVGEAPNDTAAIRNLLSKKYAAKELEFVNLINNITGAQLDNKYTETILRLEFQAQKPDLIILIRDLDAPISNREMLLKRKGYFIKNYRILQRKAIFLLHIQEVEALILADIEIFNNEYNTSIEKIENVMTVSNPKEYLKSHNSKYSESHNANLFEKIRFEKLLACIYFEKFIKEFEKQINL